MTDAREVAGKLTKAQRLYVGEGPHRHWTPTRRALFKIGLVDAAGDFTPFGLAVRRILMEQDHDQG